MEKQHNIGPLMANDKAVTMIEGFSIFRMQAGAMLAGAIDNHGNFPGHIFQMVQRFRHLLGLFPCEIL